MAKNNQPRTPLVTSVSTRLKKTIGHPDTQVVTPEEVKEKKKKLLNAVEKSADNFIKNLEDGKIQMNSSADLERIVKLTMLLSGEADTVSGRPYGEQEQETSVEMDMSMSKINEILNLDDPEVKSLYEKISKGYNEANDFEE